MKRLQALLLGPPEIRWDDQLFSIQRRYPRALLLYLASRGRMVSRHELLTLLWGEEPDATARLRLRETLGKLKGALPDPSLLISDHDLVGLDFKAVYVDLLEFRELTRQVQPDSWTSLPTGRDSAVLLPQNVYQNLNNAVSLWRGPGFLSGADLPSTPGFDDWLVSTGQQVEHQRSWALEKLSEHASAMGDLEQALRYARAALENDELNEDLHEQVLRLLIHMGHRIKAREYFNYYTDLVQRELQAPPSQKILALGNSIDLKSKSTQTLSSRQKTTWRVRSSLETPLVGRKVQLERLNRAYQKGGGVFIFGEFGLGKTRLVKEFVESLDPQPRILLNRCLPNEKSLPFQPIIDLSREIITLEEWLQYPEEWVSHALTVVPDLKKLFPEVKPALPVVPEQARGLLLEGVRQMALILARKRRLVAFLDDAQWADEATLATLSYLLERQPFDQEALLIVALRDDQPNPDLEILLHRLEANVNVSKIYLTRLGPEDTSDIARYVLGKRPNSQVAQLLTNATGGNPLFLLESLRTLKDRLPDQELTGIVNLPLAKNLYALIRSRLQLLSPKVRTILDVAAVVGDEFSPILLEHVSQYSSEEVIAAIEDLENRKLIEFVNQGGNNICCRFIHDQFREVLLMEINPMRAQKLHGAVARSLETMPGNKFSDQAGILAQHYELAGERNKAFEYWLKAGIHSRHLFAYTDASRAFSRAQAALDGPGVEVGIQDIAQLYVEWSEMANEIDDVQALRQIGEKLLNFARQRHNRSLTGVAYTILCDAWMDENLYEDGLAYADRAISILEQADILSRLAYTHVQRGVCFYMLNRLNDAEKAFQRVLELNLKSQETLIIRSRANTHYHLANISNLTAWPQKSRQFAQDALTDFNEINNFYGQASVYHALVLSYHLTGEYHEAVRSGQRGLELAQMIKADRIQAVLHAMLSMTEMSLGHIGPAFEHANHSIEIGNRINHPEIAGIGYRMLGDLYAIFGDAQAAFVYFQRGLAATGQSFLGVDNMMRLGYALCHLGRFDEGLKYMELSEKICNESGQVMTAVIGKIGRATASIILGDWSQAAGIARQVLEIAGQRSLHVWRLAALSIIGAASFQNGNCDEAELIFKGILAQIPQVPNRWTEIRAQAYLEKIYEREGKPSEEPRLRIRELLDQIEKTMGSCDQTILDNFRSFQDSDFCAF